VTQRHGKSRPARWRADTALFVVALIWGTTFVVVKNAIAEISPAYFLALRFWLATACMSFIFAPALFKAGWRNVWRGLRGGAAAGVFLWLGYIFQTLGLQYTTAGNSGFLTGLYIVLVPLVSASVYRRWPQLSELGGIAIAFAGMLLLTLPSLGHQFQFNHGDLLTIVCAFAFAFHLLTLGYFSQRERFEAVAVGQILCAAVLSSVMVLFERPTAIWTPNVVVGILLTGVCATALAFALQTWAQQYTTATRTALIFALEPVFAFVTAVLTGGETLKWSAVLGGTLIVGGILLVELKSPRPA
jgi:drug/metabolite transporter (DMT)-like permease